MTKHTIKENIAPVIGVLIPVRCMLWAYGKARNENEMETRNGNW